MYKLSLQSGCTCPNRDGSISYGGCTFCSEGGSGDFAAPCLSVREQIALAKKRVDDKFPKRINTQDRKYIAYFQSFTNTYGDISRLYTMYREALNEEEIVALSIGTRPDCLGDDAMDMIVSLNKIKPVWVEMGLQTIHEKTALSFNRGYSLAAFETSYSKLKKSGITVIAHIILGLPGESETDMLETVSYLSTLDPCLDGIKIQNLNILDGTKMAEDYRSKPFKILSMEEYGSLLVKCLKILKSETVIHRMTGDGPKRILIEPVWIADKKKVMNYLNSLIEKS